MTEDLRQRRRSALVGGIAGALLFALIAAVVNADPHWLRTLDHELGAGPQRVTADHGWLLDTANVLAEITFPDYLVLLVVLTAVVLVVKGYWRAAVWSLIVIEVGRWSYLVLKAIFERPRPDWAHPTAHAGGWSFPSGHATSIGAFAGVVIVLAIMLSPTRRLRFRLIGGALLLAAAVGLDRVLLGVHYPSDVVAGLLLGAVITLLSLAAFDPLPRPGGARRPPPRRRAEPHRATISP